MVFIIGKYTVRPIRVMGDGLEALADELEIIEFDALKTTFLGISEETQGPNVTRKMGNPYINSIQ